jgi:hypothetical protein
LPYLGQITTAKYNICYIKATLGLEKAQEEQKLKQKDAPECTFKPDLVKSKTIYNSLQPSYSTISEF